MTRTRRKYQDRKRVVNDGNKESGENDGVVQHQQVDSNVDMLPAKREKKSKKKQPKEKPLSRKERRKLEQIVKRKAVKQQRSEIIDALQKVQASVEQTRFMVSSTSIYNGGDFSQAAQTSQSADASGVQLVATSLRGANKQKRRESEHSEDDEDGDSVATSAISTDSEVERELDEMDHRRVEPTETVPPAPADAQCDSSAVKDVTKPQEPSSDNEDAVSNSCVNEEAMKRIRQQFNVPVNRIAEVIASRQRLPIIGDEHTVMEAINGHQVTIVCGETGSGKTTQVPQFLFEAGYASGAYRIAVTEPRRIATISMSQRVAHELNAGNELVGYKIRYEGNVTPATRLVFMTDGVLLKEVQKDFLLRDYSVIVLDEVHERSVFTDILIGLLSRIVRLREKQGEPLKLVLMSATMRVSDFADNRRLFPHSPPIINIATRQFPVSVHFNRRTPPQTAYVNAALRKVISLHASMPEGAVLVFVATANDVRALCALLNKANERALARNQQLETQTAASNQQSDDKQQEVDLDCLPAFPSKSVEINAESMSTDDGKQTETKETLDTEYDEQDAEAEEAWLAKHAVFAQCMHVLPLYSLLPTIEQMRVFQPAPADSRTVVVATNVAETSLTIPGIRYVVDSGLAKRKYYDRTLGISQFRIEWCSKASANQRAGRAGRLGPGHAYRLYSSAVFCDMNEFSEPEILQRPLDDIVLQTKALGIDNVFNFPFPNAPGSDSLQQAEQVLLALGAVQPASVANVSRISELGERLAAFSVSPRCAKLLLLATQFDILQYAVLLAAALSVPEVLLENSHVQVALRRGLLNSSEWRKLGDFGVLLKTLAAVQFATRDQPVEQVCAQFAVRVKAYREVNKLCDQLRKQVHSTLGLTQQQHCRMEPPNERQLNMLRQCLVCVLCDHVLRHVPNNADGAKSGEARYEHMLMSETVLVHPHSALHADLLASQRAAKKDDYTFLLFGELHQNEKHVYARSLCVVDADWLQRLCDCYCHFGPPDLLQPVRFDQQRDAVLCHRPVTYGAKNWPLGLYELRFPDGADCVKQFAKLLVEGHVFPKLQRFVPCLLFSPTVLVRTWSSLHNRAAQLLNCLLRANNADCREKLLARWRTEPLFLLEEYAAWLPQSMYYQVRDVWPPCETESAQ